MGKAVKKKDKPQGDDKQTKISSFFTNQPEKKGESLLFTRLQSVPLPGAGKLSLTKIKGTVKGATSLPKVKTVNKKQGEGSRQKQSMSTKSISQNEDVIILDDEEPAPEIDFKNIGNVNDYGATDVSHRLPDCGENFSNCEVNKNCGIRQPVRDEEYQLNPFSGNDNSLDNHPIKCSTVACEVAATNFKSSNILNNLCETSQICEATEASFTTPRKQCIKDKPLDSIENSPDIICETPNVDSIFQDAAERRRKTVSSRSFLCPKNLLAIQPGLKPAHLRLNQRKGARKLLGNVSVTFTSNSESLGFTAEDEAQEESCVGVINAVTLETDASNHDDNFDGHNICTENHGIRQGSSKPIRPYEEKCFKRSGVSEDIDDVMEKLETDRFCIPETQLFSNAADIKTADYLEDDFDVDTVMSDVGNSPEILQKEDLLTKYSEKLWSHRHDNNIENDINETEENDFYNSTKNPFKKSVSEYHTRLLTQKVSSYDKTTLKSHANHSTKPSSKLINALEEADSRAEITEETLWLEQRLMKHFSDNDFASHSEKSTEETVLQNPNTTPVKIYGDSKRVVKRQAKPGLSPFSKRQPNKEFTELKDIAQMLDPNKARELAKLSRSISKAKKILCLDKLAPYTDEIQHSKPKLNHESRTCQFDLKKKKGDLESNDKNVTLENDGLLCELLGKLKSPSKADGSATVQVLKELNPAQRAGTVSLEKKKCSTNKSCKENYGFLSNKNVQTADIVRQSDIEMLDQLFGKDTSDSEEIELCAKETNVYNQVSHPQLGIKPSSINTGVGCYKNSKHEEPIMVLDDTPDTDMNQRYDCIIIEDSAGDCPDSPCTPSTVQPHIISNIELNSEQISIGSAAIEMCNKKRLDNLGLPDARASCNPTVPENVNCSISEDNFVTVRLRANSSTTIHVPQAVATDIPSFTSSEPSKLVSEHPSSTLPAEYPMTKEATVVDIKQNAHSVISSGDTTLTLAVSTSSVTPSSCTVKSEFGKHNEMLTTTANIPPILACKEYISGNNINNEEATSYCTEDSTAVITVKDTASSGCDEEMCLSTTCSGPREETELSTSMYDLMCEGFDEEFQDNSKHAVPEKDFRFSDLWNRFTVLEVVHDRNEIHLRLLSDKTRRVCQCILRGFWMDTIIGKEDVVNIVGDFTDDICIIDDRNGLIIVNPDKLLSGTSVVNSTFCARKSVLNEKFKGVDSGNIQMFYGSVIHSLFQVVLKDCVRNQGAIMRVANSLLKTNKFLHEMYNRDVEENAVMEEIGQYSPTLSSWLAKHTQAARKEGTVKLPESDLVVTEIHDIEENIWSPRFGLKGKIDVTVKAKLRKSNSLEEVKIVPLELKTGKASFSIEHKGQVTLYSMMCSDRREDPEEGVLLYLKHGEMELVPVKPQNKSGLIQLRNTLAHYLTQEVCQETAADGQRTYRLGQLPQPINSHRACSKCAHLLNCSIYQRHVEHSGDSGSEAMNSLVEDSLQHLGEPDLSYFTHWMLCLDLEGQESQKLQLSQIWRSSSSEREKNGDCLSNLVIASSDLDIEESQCFSEGRGCSITFTRDSSFQGSSLNAVGLVNNDMVVISSEDGRFIALATGFVRRILHNLVEVVVDRDYLHDTRAYSNMRFRLDKNDSFSTSGSLFTNLSRLMESTPRATFLRNLIITLKPPEFHLKLSKPCIQKVKAVFKPLNKPQRTAILKVLMAKDYVLIKGFPGTGKTATIVALVKILRLIGQSVLLTSYTHSAVDNILLKLKEDDIPFLRLGRRSRIHPSLLSHSAEVLTSSLAVNSVQELKRFYDSYDVVATSALGVNHPVFNRRKFDVCIVDEASQVLQPACLGPLFCCQKFVLVGDPKQLPPVVQSRVARNLGMDESLFARLANSGATYDLCLQYRMNRVIMELSNSLVYDGKLQCGSLAVADQCCTLNHLNILDTPAWVKDALSADLDKSVVFLDTQRVFSVEVVSIGKSLINEAEANLVMVLLKALMKADVAADEVGVISPYRSQVRLIKQKVLDCSDVMDVEVNTVDQYQGRDKSIIIMSFVRTQNDNVGELLKDLRRLNVALTRAKHKLILIGNAKTLTAYEHIANILMRLKETNSIIQIPQL